MLFFAALFQAADSRRRQIADGIDNLEEEAVPWQWPIVTSCCVAREVLA